MGVLQCLAKAPLLWFGELITEQSWVVCQKVVLGTFQKIVTAKDTKVCKPQYVVEIYT